MDCFRRIGESSSFASEASALLTLKLLFWECVVSHKSNPFRQQIHTNYLFYFIQRKIHFPYPYLEFIEQISNKMLHPLLFKFTEQFGEFYMFSVERRSIPLESMPTIIWLYPFSCECKKKEKITKCHTLLVLSTAHTSHMTFQFTLLRIFISLKQSNHHSVLLLHYSASCYFHIKIG
jgi:hypothetical protein